MTVEEVFVLRTQGRIEEAYDAIRSLYAVDKRPYTSLAMFLTAADILKKRVGEGQHQEAECILKALERMLPQVPDKEGWVKNNFERCCALLNQHKQPSYRKELSEHLRMGIWGEELAASYLRQKGYVILHRDWHSVHRDIDIIAQEGNTIVFVEVKTRRNRDFGDPVQAIDAEKRYNLRKAMNHYIKYHKINIPYRFDVITIVGEMGNEMPDITHIEDFNIVDSPSQVWHKKR
jgi:uncharacterized protein (TIGR00252 family)